MLTWVHRIARIQVRERDLFGHWASRWRVIRTSNAYVFRDPQPRPEGVPASKSENRGGTQNQDVSKPVPVAVRDPDSPLERALARFAAALAAKEGIEQGSGGSAARGGESRCNTFERNVRSISTDMVAAQMRYC